MNIVITGASRGIGRAIAEAFAADGEKHVQVLCGQNSERLEQSRQELQERYPATVFMSYACDMADKAAVLQLGNWLQQQLPHIDVLVNNAGTFVPGSVHNEEDGVLEQLLAVNLHSAYHLTRALLPVMMQHRSGHIFNMCSTASLHAYANGGSYSISKFALLGFGKNLREEMKPYGIKVTNIMPGAVYTDSWAESNVDPKRLMEANDVAKLVYTMSHLSAMACVEDILLRPQPGDL